MSAREANLPTDLAGLAELTQALNLHVPPSYFPSTTTRLPYEQAVAPIVDSPTTGPTHLYVGVPLCEEHCNFCMYFYGFADVEGSAAQACVNGLTDFLAQLAPQVHTPIAGMYIGGGTPSVLEPVQIEGLLTAINATFAFEESAQRTFEMSPKSITEAKLVAVAANGIRRISFGVQSLDPEPVRRANRGYVGPARIARIFDQAAAAGITDVNADLMVGLAGEGPESLSDSVATLIKMSCPTISIYRYRPARKAELAASGGFARYVEECTAKVERAVAVATALGYVPNGRSDGEHLRLGPPVPCRWPERNLYETRYRPQWENSLIAVGSGGRSFQRDRRFVHCPHRPKAAFGLVGREVEVEDCDQPSRTAAALVNELFREFRVDLSTPEFDALPVEVAQPLDTLIARGIVGTDGQSLWVERAHRDAWMYWDKLLYPPRWLAERAQVDRLRVR
ncbi:radical SAM protein [Nocardia salmonicida]|uniref:radical SAM protein n=1 Tax=Nocardia salmonicida TaxID=53431 RepID=UPI0033E4F793